MGQEHKTDDLVNSGGVREKVRTYWYTGIRLSHSDSLAATKGEMDARGHVVAALPDGTRLRLFTIACALSDTCMISCAQARNSASGTWRRMPSSKMPPPYSSMRKWILAAR